MTPADKPMDRQYVVQAAHIILREGEASSILSRTQFARAVLAMDEELCKTGESGKEK